MAHVEIRSDRRRGARQWDGSDGRSDVTTVVKGPQSTACTSLPCCEAGYAEVHTAQVMQVSPVRDLRVRLTSQSQWLRQWDLDCELVGVNHASGLVAGWRNKLAACACKYAALFIVITKLVAVVT